MNQRVCFYCGLTFKGPVRGAHYHGFYFHCGCGAESGVAFLAPCA